MFPFHPQDPQDPSRRQLLWDPQHPSHHWDPFHREDPCLHRDLSHPQDLFPWGRDLSHPEIQSLPEIQWDPAIPSHPQDPWDRQIQCHLHHRHFRTQPKQTARGSHTQGSEREASLFQGKKQSVVSLRGEPSEHAEHQGG
jgi:hypothetical protein